MSMTAFSAKTVWSHRTTTQEECYSCKLRHRLLRLNFHFTIYIYLYYGYTDIKI